MRGARADPVRPHLGAITLRIGRDVDTLRKLLRTGIKHPMRDMMRQWVPTIEEADRYYAEEQAEIKTEMEQSATSFAEVAERYEGEGSRRRGHITT